MSNDIAILAATRTAIGSFQGGCPACRPTPWARR